MEFSRLKTNSLHQNQYQPNQLEQKSDEDFREYIRSLLSTFMSEKYLEIYMSDTPLPFLSNKQLDISENPEILYGPFSIIRQAFTDELVSTLNLTTLEFYGDGRLETGIEMFIMTNFPNLRSAEQLNNMKTYYVNNDRLASYADQLGLTSWMLRDKSAGISNKEKANVFEAFIGALVMIGEYYIGFMVGETVGRLFIENFYATQKWTTNPEEYLTSATLINDWTMALPENKKVKVDYFETRDRDKTFLCSARATGPGLTLDSSNRNRKITVTGAGRARTKADAKEMAAKELMRKLNLTRNTIEEIRKEKRDKEPGFREQYQRLEKAFPDKEFRFPTAIVRGKNKTVFFYVLEKQTPSLGRQKDKKENLHFTFYEKVARGIGSTAIEALTDAVTNLIAGRRFTPVFGQAGLDRNLDTAPEFLTTELIEKTSNESKGAIVPKSYYKEEGSGRGVGGSGSGRGRGDDRGGGRGRGRGSFHGNTYEKRGSDGGSGGFDRNKGRGSSYERKSGERKEGPREEKYKKSPQRESFQPKEPTQPTQPPTQPSETESRQSKMKIPISTGAAKILKRNPFL